MPFQYSVGDSRWQRVMRGEGFDDRSMSLRRVLYIGVVDRKRVELYIISLSVRWLDCFGMLAIRSLHSSIKLVFSDD